MAGPLRSRPAWTVGERMKMEKEALGFFLTGHPVTAFRDEIEAFGYRCIADTAPSTNRTFCLCISAASFFPIARRSMSASPRR